MRTMIAALLLCVYIPALSQTQPPAPAPAAEDPAHNELRALRAGMQAAIRKGDIEGQLAYLHPNVVVTWQNAEVSRGRDAVRAYLDRMLKGPDKVVERYNSEIDVTELTILYGGDTGVSYGTSKDHIALTDGTALDYNARWSATLVKEGGRWLIANAHASTNLFENPLLDRVKRMIFLAGVGALVAGVVLGFLLGRRRKFP